jgi:hypothetical protein
MPESSKSTSPDGKVSSSSSEPALENLAKLVGRIIARRWRQQHAERLASQSLDSDKLGEQQK